MNKYVCAILFFDKCHESREKQLVSSEEYSLKSELPQEDLLRYLSAI